MHTVQAPRLRRWLRIAGIALVIAGTQAWVFHARVASSSARAVDALTALQREQSDSARMNASLEALQQYWRATDDKELKSRVLAARDTVLEIHARDRAAAVGELQRLVTDFEGSTDRERTALDDLRRQTGELADLYVAHTREAITRYADPSWYLWPTASILNNGDARLRVLEFNHALYLMGVGDRESAREFLDELRRGADSSPDAGGILYALARLQYMNFVIEKDPSLFGEAVEFDQQSVHREPHAALPKLFLDFLVSVDQRAIKVDMDPTEGQGSGKGEGDHGAISKGREAF